MARIDVTKWTRKAECGRWTKRGADQYGDGGGEQVAAGLEIGEALSGELPQDHVVYLGRRAQPDGSRRAKKKGGGAQWTGRV